MAACVPASGTGSSSSLSSSSLGFEMPMDENANGYLWGVINPSELARILTKACHKVSENLFFRNFLRYLTTSKIHIRDVVSHQSFIHRLTIFQND